MCYAHFLDDENESLKDKNMHKTIWTSGATGPELSSFQEPCHNLASCVNICVPTIRLSIIF